jgi:hypothetical protein
MSKGLNPELNVGDKVVCYHMEGEMSVPPGTKGTVWEKTIDPFVKDGFMYKVEWENGSKLPLLTDTDTWKKLEQEIREEKSFDPMMELFKKNKSLFKHFDLDFFREFLLKLRESGITNMYGSSPLIYAGKDHIERYYGEGKEDDENFQELLDIADQSRDKLVSGLVSFAKEQNIDLEDENKLNQLARQFAKDILVMYINTF